MSTNELMQRRGAMMQSRSGGIDWESIARGMCDCVTGFSIPAELKIQASSSNVCGYRVGLESAEIPNTMTSIGQNAFIGCSGLKSVIIPNTVTSIGNYAFRSCTALEEVICDATTPPTLSSNCFFGIQVEFLIYVPDESVDAYKSADNWSSYASRIKGISERP